MLNNFLNTFLLIKIALLTVIGLCIVFSLVIVTQIKTMNEITNLNSHNVIFYFGILGTLISVSLFLLSLAIL